MSFLPIVERELRVVARKASIYRRRTGVALLSTGAAVIFLLIGRFSGSTRLGGDVFATLVVLAFIYCLCEGLRAADSLSEENREGTLGLLFLTDLRGYDVVLGKLSAVAVRSFHGLLAFLPVLAMALILGGVTVGEFWRSALVLLDTLLFSLSVALCISAWGREVHRVMGATVLSLALITGGPLLLRQGAASGVLWPVLGNVAFVSPATALRDAQDVLHRSSSAEFWASIGCTFCLALLALATASQIVRSSWREPDTNRGWLRRQTRWQKWRSGKPEERRAFRRQRLDQNPFFWLCARHQHDSRLINQVFGMVSLLGFTAWFCNLRTVALTCSAVATGVLVGWLGWRAVVPFGEARQNGALEPLLVTPIRVEEMIAGHWLALKDLFLWPAALVFSLRLTTLVGPDLATIMGLSWRLGVKWAAAGFHALSFVIKLLAIFWLGMWMGASQRKLPRAFLMTLLVGWLLPGVLFCIPNIAIHLGLLSYARRRLLHELRRVASGENARHLSQTIGPPPVRRPKAPPLIAQG